MTPKTLRKIFEIGFALIVIAAFAWGIFLTYRWYQVLHRPAVQLITVDHSDETD